MKIAWDNVAVFTLLVLYALVLAPWLGLDPWPAVAFGAVWAYANRA